MKSYKSIYIFLLLFGLLIGSSQSNAQGFLKTQGKAIVAENGDTVILRAMGLGGWMLQEGYMLQTSGFANAQYEIREKIEELIGPEDTDLFYDQWLANHVREADIDSLYSWGFNAVRLPMHYKLYTLPIEEEPVPGENTWLAKGFELTDSLLSWCTKRQMYVLLDLHGAPGGQGYEGAISDYDPSKPSLWESEDNRNKTIALWRKLAERYADEPYIMGYDLLNETNWNLPGGSALRSLYIKICNAIREVDDKHIIFIEGNWFANDFTGLTPPWDDNMVYSPHKYWSKNETKDIQWVLTIRDQYDIPLYFSESGENSNTWFTNAIRLLEGEGLGWAWWPMKKIESISCPTSIVKTPEYQDLLDYWNGNAPKPSKEVAKATLMELTENLKVENCVFQKDVIDAMFRQVKSKETIPYAVQNIPGVVYASDFSLGRNGYAYFDVDVADYHVTTGNYTAWNNGWAYRNDGVDIEKIDDNVNSNGYAVGWIAENEWLQFDIDVEENAVYDIKMRYAAGSSDGSFYFESGDAPIHELIDVPSTGGWYTWKTLTVPDVILTTDMNKIVFKMISSGFNVSSFEFVKKSPIDQLETNYVSAFTLDENTIQLILNKPIEGPLPIGSAGFTIRVGYQVADIEKIEINSTYPRFLTFTLVESFTSDDVLDITYLGNEIKAVDNTKLAHFLLKEIDNDLIQYQQIPGRIEAEDYHYQQGIQLENCTDEGGGKNIGYLDQGDFLEYYVDIQQAGIYNVEYRTAAESAVGRIELFIEEAATGDLKSLHTLSFTPTGGWQNWRSTNVETVLPAGKHKFRLEMLKSQFNINWFEFTFKSVDNEDIEPEFTLDIFPNPSHGMVYVNGLQGKKDAFRVMISSPDGRILEMAYLDGINNKLPDLSHLQKGMYIIQFFEGKKLISSKKLLINSER